MQQVHFYGLSEIAGDKLQYAVIMASYQEKWIFVRHKERTTWEIPGGHREKNEDITCTAKRELYEETGAIKYIIKPVAIYSVVGAGTESFGQLFFAAVSGLALLPGSEIAEIKMMDVLPEGLTYPFIIPALFDKISLNVDSLLADMASVC